MPVTEEIAPPDAPRSVLWNGHSLTVDRDLPPLVARVRRDLIWVLLQTLKRGGQPEPQLRRYLGWEEFRRRQFERALGCLLQQAPRQYVWYMLTVLSLPEDEAALAAARGVTESDLRTGRMRACRFMKDSAGTWIEWEWRAPGRAAQ